MTETQETFLSIPKEKWDEIQALCKKHHRAVEEIIFKMAEVAPRGTFRWSTPVGYITFHTKINNHGTL